MKGKDDKVTNQAKSNLEMSIVHVFILITTVAFLTVLFPRFTRSLDCYLGGGGFPPELFKSIAHWSAGFKNHFVLITLPLAIVVLITDIWLLHKVEFGWKHTIVAVGLPFIALSLIAVMMFSASMPFLMIRDEKMRQIEKLKPQQELAPAPEG